MILQVGKIGNSNAEEFFCEAHKIALEADENRASQRERLNVNVGDILPCSRLLEGLPISVKDQFQQKGATSSCGLASRLQYQYESDGLLIELLRDGACYLCFLFIIGYY